MARASHWLRSPVEFGGDDGQLHRLFLKNKGDTQSLFQVRYQFMLRMLRTRPGTMQILSGF